MGIKDLWTILNPFCERKPLFELQGKKVAIDLSCWICEAQNISEYQVQPRMYLRNLYFRTCYLLLMDVNPVFVLEGKAPTLKYNTIAARNAIQFKGAKPRKNEVKGCKDRSRFNYTLKQCEEMLNHMGLVCVKGNGEAEAMCAYLNQDDLVDGCISQDSDCFAYGAKVVYRNFSISQQGNHSASGGAVDIYNIKTVQEKLDFGRNKIIALALLCGSDYSEGVHGVGKDSALKFFEQITDNDVLNRMRSWSQDSITFQELQKKISDKTICVSCGHFGKAQTHTKNGCIKCGTATGCNDVYKKQYLCYKNELSMRAKALNDPEFPNENLISEFLIRKDKISKLDLEWKKPQMLSFVKFTVKYLGWEEIYAFEKLLPILTRWQLLNPNFVNEQSNLNGIIYPECIKKIRNPKGVSSYEIIWADTKQYFANLIPEEQLENVNIEKLWSTIEPQDLVKTTYPKLVAEFEQSKIKIKKPTKRKQKKLDALDELENMLQNTSISKESVVKKKPKKCKNKLPDTHAATIDNYFKTAIINNHNLHHEDTEKCGIFYNSTPTKHNYSFDINASGLEDDNCHDLSNIVESIIKREPSNIIQEKLSEINRNLVFNEMQNSSFFCSSFKPNDLFEQSFNDLKASDDDDEIDLITEVPETSKRKYLTLNDSFEINTTSLFDRIKLKKTQERF